MIHFENKILCSLSNELVNKQKQKQKKTLSAPLFTKPHKKLTFKFQKEQPVKVQRKAIRPFRKADHNATEQYIKRQYAVLQAARAPQVQQELQQPIIYKQRQSNYIAKTISRANRETANVKKNIKTIQKQKEQLRRALSKIETLSPRQRQKERDKIYGEMFNIHMLTTPFTRVTKTHMHQNVQRRRIEEQRQRIELQRHQQNLRLDKIRQETRRLQRANEERKSTLYVNLKKRLVNKQITEQEFKKELKNIYPEFINALINEILQMTLASRYNQHTSALS